MDRDSERLKTLKEIDETLGLKGEIEAFLKSSYFDETKARELIEKVNNKHSENIILYKIATYKVQANNTSGVCIESVQRWHGNT